MSSNHLTNGRYEVRTWQVEGVLGIWWIQAGARANRDPDIIVGAERLPQLAEAIAEWEMEHTVAPAPPQVPGPRSHLRPVTDDGVV